MQQSLLCLDYIKIISFLNPMVYYVFQEELAYSDKKEIHGLLQKVMEATDADGEEEKVATDLSRTGTSVSSFILPSIHSFSY